ncbi:hypothetical protein FV222_22730 [Methylobacterium sp. WL103]|nr:hypothetical protein FV222_22730 [Methylobacterium sp. WL103]
MPPAMLPSAKLALARLTNVPATATAPGGKGTAQTAAKGRPDLAAKPAAKFADKSPDKRGARLAGIY